MLLSSFLYQRSNADTFHIVTSQETSCPGEFSGVPCLSLQHYASNPSINTGNITLLFQSRNHTLATAFSVISASSYTLTGEDVIIECVSSAAQWTFLSIQQVHMRGISFFRCHGGMTFTNIEVLTMENINEWDYGISRSNIECVSSAVRHEGMTFRNIEVLTMENINEWDYGISRSNLECVTYAAQWNFLTIQQVHMRGISFFRCHGGMTFRNIELLTMENINEWDYGISGSNLECVSSAAQWNFLTIQQVHMRGINFFRCHGGMTFRNIEVLTIENITEWDYRIKGSNVSSTTPQWYFSSIQQVHMRGISFWCSRRLCFGNIKTLTMENIKNENNMWVHPHAAITAYNVAQIYITTCTFSNCNGGVFYVRYSSMEIFGSIFHNNYRYYGGGVLHYWQRGTHQNNITITNSTFTNNRAGRYGGGAIYVQNSLHSYRYNLYTYSVVLSISNSSFNSNRARDHGGAVYYDGDEELNITQSMFTNSIIDYGNGGAIYSRSSVTVTSCNISGNTANQTGGGIYSSSSVIAEKSDFFNNIGGVIYSLSEVVICNCTISGNTGGTHGGAVSSSSSVTATNCNITGNTANSFGGAIFSSSSVTVNCNISGNIVNQCGGAIYSSFSVTTTNCSISENSANQHGGAIYSQFSSVTIAYTNLSDNRAGTQGGAIYSLSELACENFVFLNNLAADGGAVFVNDSSSFTSCEFYNNTAQNLEELFTSLEQTVLLLFLMGYLSTTLQLH